MAAQNSVTDHIAKPYAAALYELAAGEGKVAEVEAGLGGLARLSTESADFKRFLRSPVIASDDKARAMDKVLADAKAAPLVANFVRAVAKNGRLFALPAMIERFSALAAAARGEVTAEVTSATPLSAAQVSALGAALKQKIGKTVNLNQHVDESLIGGLVVKVGSQMIDSSLKTKLEAMKIAMKEVR